MTNFLSTLPTVSSLVLILFLTWKEYRSGNFALAKKIKEDYKERNEQLEGRIEELEDKQQAQSLQMAKLEAILAEKDKQLTDYKEIFANRNPDLTTVLGEIKTFMENIYNQNKHQTKILEERQDRDKKVDAASLNKKNNI